MKDIYLKLIGYTIIVICFVLYTFVQIPTILCNIIFTVGIIPLLYYHYSIYSKTNQDDEKRKHKLLFVALILIGIAMWALDYM